MEGNNRNGFKPDNNIFKDGFKKFKTFMKMKTKREEEDVDMVDDTYHYDLQDRNPPVFNFGPNM